MSDYRFPTPRQTETTSNQQQYLQWFDSVKHLVTENLEHEANRRLMENTQTGTINTGQAAAPVSLPVIQPQPDEEQYGVPDIALFQQYTRESYEMAFGVQPKPFDPGRPIQTWFDTSEPGYDSTYLQLTEDDGLQEFDVTAADRATPNLPGRYRYPQPVYAPTKAYQTWPDGSQHPINPSKLMTHNEALRLQLEIHGSMVVHQQLPMYPYVYPYVYPDVADARRVYLIIRDGEPVSAALLRQLRACNGVGAPGEWDLSNPGALRWAPGPIPDGSGVSDYMPMPVRELLANERVETIFGGLAVIRRTDMGPAAVGFTGADRVRLCDIEKALLVLLKAGEETAQGDLSHSLAAAGDRVRLTTIEAQTRTLLVRTGDIANLVAMRK